MRPLRLEIEGFASFRSHACVDFTDADLFVLFGPTGAGKSSLIDAITFALYGTVPRYDDQRLVAPVISQGANEAKVRLDFRAAGKTWTAVRVVKRTSTGATTREARLETDAGTVVAGNADELTAKIQEVIGLSFDHFTRCVVLPQGDFAEFLHARPSDRGDLLIQLLGLDIYRRVAQAANQRAAERSQAVALLGERLERELAAATEEALAGARDRVAALQQLLALLEADRPELETRVRLHETVTAAARDAEARATALSKVKVPPGTEELAMRVAAANTALESAENVLRTALEAGEASERSRSEMPERAKLTGAIEKHTRNGQLEEQRKRTEADVTSAAEALNVARNEADACDGAIATAQAAMERLRRAHAAFHLAEHVAAGEPCPVCLQTVKKAPKHGVPADLRTTEQAHVAAEAARTRARDVLKRAEQAAIRRNTELEGLNAQIAALTEECKDLPRADEARAQLLAVDRLEAALRAVRAAEAVARRTEQHARETVRSVLEEQTRARAEFDRLRDGLAAAALAPPPAKRLDLNEDWCALMTWAHARAPEERNSAAGFRKEATEAAAWVERTIARQRAACGALGIAAGTGDPYPACVSALATARASAERIEHDLDTARRVRSELAAAEKETRIARELGRQLNANNFERWLMSRALHTLVEGASQRLHQLSGGAYSLSLDARNEFLVVDHRNADEPRLARTLSGGETFLASLALALSLAEHVAHMTSGGTARLEALFLDEGFGTLDAETLDVVATAIEELGARGRMVGIVTHVRELAERIPVRFEVRKVAGVSSIERIA